MINSGRRTVDNSEDLVVFLVGARINKWWLLPLSLPILARMGAMLRELQEDPNSGLLAVQSLGFGGSVQYWKSIEHLRNYAQDRTKAHKPAWMQFMKKIFKNAAAGVWHETYFVRAGHYESIYTNMPAFGMGRYKSVLPAEGKRATQDGRLSRLPE